MKINDTVLFELEGKKLYREKNLIDIYVPVFFVCIDSNLQRYLTICLDDETDEYLIAKVTNEKLSNMLKSCIPMRDLYTESKSVYYVKAGESFEDDIVKKISSDEINEEDLPTKNALFEIDNDDEINNYIIELSGKVAVFKENSDSFNLGIKKEHFNSIYSQYDNQNDYGCCSYKFDKNHFNKTSKVRKLEQFNDPLLAAS